MSLWNRDNRHRHKEPAYFSTLPAFTSGDAHNGCRALFNGVAGWAFFGPAGFIEPSALPPGTESYACDFKQPSRGGGGKKACPSRPGEGLGRKTHDARGAHPESYDSKQPSTGGKKASSFRPGEGLGRKTSDARSAYLDAEDLRHLVRGISETDVDAGEERMEGSGAAVGAGTAALRKGRPIVLTLQAILAATSPASPAAAAIEAAAAVAAAGARAEERDSARRSPESGAGSSPPSVAIADSAQFPPLLLRGASADKGPGLFLAPPITMVKNGAAAAAQSGESGSDGGGVSCSEAVAATSVAEAAAHDGGSGQAEGGEAGAVAGGGGMSRIGWWLRWATTPSGADNDDATADGVMSLETSAGADGWQVVSAPAAGARPAAAVAAEASSAVAVYNSDDEEAGSWCDFATEEGMVDVGEIDRAPVVPLAVRDDASGAAGGTGAQAVAIEDALKRAAGGTIYDDGSSFAGEGDDDDDDYNDGDEAALEREESTIACSGSDDGDRIAPQVVSPNVPRSFRDTLMAPSVTGAVSFSDSKALLRTRASASAAASPSASPTLVDGGADGGAVFLWWKAAAGEGE